jgi:hypothetical protein
MKWRIEAPKKVDRPFRHYLVIVATAPSGYYARMIDNTGPREVKSIELNGHKYAIDPEEARRLKGWRGKAKDGFWAEFVDIVPSRIGVLFYVEPTDPLHGVEIPIPPVDRVNEIDLERVDSPAVYNAILNSPLYRRYQARLKFGAGTNWLLVALVMIGLVGVLIVLAMSGYFDSGAR